MISVVSRNRFLVNLQPNLLRFASKKVKQKVSEKIPVQLLKDHSTLGKAGEIIRVRPAYMRNFLHMNNGACYITKEQGPRIPVIEKTRNEKKVEVKVEGQAEKEIELEAKSNAMSLDELTTLFNSMRSKSSKGFGKEPEVTNQTFETSDEEIPYTASELKSFIPSTHTIVLSDQINLPIEKQFLSSLIFDISGIQVSNKSIRLVSKKNESTFLNEITEVGDYIWIFDVPGERSTIRKTLRVQQTE